MGSNGDFDAFANTPTTTYSYDGSNISNSKGRLTRVSSSESVYDYLEFDPLGRVKQTKQTTTGGAAQGYALSYTYNLAGEMKTETYPSGRIITTGYDTAGRINQVSGQKTAEPDKTYASAFSFAAHGAVSSMQLGNGKWEHTLFNNRLQPIEIGLGANIDDAGTLKLEYTYGTTANNGNVLTQKITAPKTDSSNLVLTQTYTYDALNRLLTASENGSPAWSQSYDYDRFGNRAVHSGSYIPTPRQTPTSNSLSDLPLLFNQNTNRIIATTDYAYDSAGNLKSMPDPAQGNPPDVMTYDAENRQKTYSAAGGAATSYTYDGDGHRVKKVLPGNPSPTTIFVYNAAGQLVAEYTSDPVPPPQGGGGTSYLTSDHLGSTRVVTSAADAGGNVTVKARYDYLPFGEQIESDRGSRFLVTGYVTSDETRQKFTQKERDIESGLDYFGARYPKRKRQ